MWVGWCFFMLQPLSALAFVVQQIRVEGLHYIQQETVLSYLPFKVGDTLTTEKNQEILKSLYGTGFFDNVQLAHQGSTLIIKVQERPVITKLQFVGNKEIKGKALEEVLKKAGMAEGQIYDDAKLKAITEGLKEAYINMGYYNVKIDSHVQGESQNRVIVTVNVNEGKIAKIKEIKILGNEEFSESKLLRQFSLTRPSLLTILTHNDRYTEEKLDKDLENLSNFYENAGYARFKILSKHVSLSPDRSEVYIVIKVSEGSVYTIEGFRLIEFPPKEESAIHNLITIESGEIFSRKIILAVNDNIAKYLANEGYAFPQVHAVPAIDDVKHTVTLEYHIVEGTRMYVRRINIIGAHHTEGMVARRELRQYEGSVFSLANVEESKRRIANLPYFADVEAKTHPVDSATDLVDVDYSVKEVSAGRATASAGYSDTERFIYGLSVNEPNILGTGKDVGISFTHSAYSTQYNFSYNNPFYTEDGVSRGFDLYYQQVTPGKVNITSYTVNGFGGEFHYGIPVTELSNLNVGAGYDRFQIGETAHTGKEVGNFLEKHGHDFNEYKLTSGWSRNTYDRFIFPTSGSSQSVEGELGVPVIRSSLGYYTASYNTNWYFPLERKHDWIVNLHGIASYGNGYDQVDNLPFFKNFFAGGLMSVPGYEGNSLGPRDEFGNAVGGNIEVVGQANLIFPNHISENIRTALTFSAGNIYNRHLDLGNLRYSTGLMIAWNSPLGATIDLGFTHAFKKPGDSTQLFQFTLGTSI